jgi:NDP-sugar pyrophosphorylase family protein
VHRARRAGATIVVSQVRSPFGVVEVRDDDTIAGFREAPLLPEWVSSGVYVLDDECIARLPERGDHETTTFPELAAEGKLVAYRNRSFWLTVNTPKQLREADEFVREHPELLPVPA